MAVISKFGWQDGISISLTDRGCLSVLLSSERHSRQEVLMGRTPIPNGVWTHVDVINEGNRLRLLVDGRSDGELPYAPLRCYGNCTVEVGAAAEGLPAYRGLFDELTISGGTELEE